MTVKSQIVAKTVVMRFRLRSAAAEPSAAPLAPPNMSESPPPCPLWSKTPTMRDNIETTFKTRVMYITIDRTKKILSPYLGLYPTDTGVSSGKWHATTLPAPSACRGGSTDAQRSVAFQQRVRKRHPDGGSIGDGTSPTSRMRFPEPGIEGLATGTADSKAFV